MRTLKPLMVTVAVLSFLLCANGQGNESPTVTFVNQSGENCLVKLVGPTAGYVNVPNATQRSISVRGGRYYILTRYGDDGHYRYTRGDPFDVTETAYSVSDISITLHTVRDGNYETRPVSGSDF
jgi:hypothetical protein